VSLYERKYRSAFCWITLNINITITKKKLRFGEIETLFFSREEKMKKIQISKKQLLSFVTTISLSVLVLIKAKAGRYTGRWEGTTSQGLPIALTVSSEDVITQVEFDHKVTLNDTCTSTYRFNETGFDIGVNHDGNFTSVNSDGVFNEEDTITFNLPGIHSEGITGAFRGLFTASTGSGRWTGYWYRLRCGSYLHYGYAFFLAEDDYAFTFNVSPAQIHPLYSVPNGQQIFTYSQANEPLRDLDPSQARPIGIGSIATGGNTMDLQVDLGEFEGMVDIYFALYAPHLDLNNIYILNSDNIFQTATVPWKQNTDGNINENLFGSIPISFLPTGTYYLGLLATPAGSAMENYHFWITQFDI